MVSRTGVDILREAIARNSPAVLSLPYLGGTPRHFKSRLLAERSGALIVENVAAEQVVVQGLIPSRQPVGVSFKSPAAKVMFASTIDRAWPVFRLNERVRVAALQLAWPADVQVIQRRADYRARVTDDVGLAVRVARHVAEHPADQPPPAVTDHPLAAKPVDLSTGGIGLAVASTDGTPLSVTVGDELRVELRLGADALSLTGVVRHVEPAAAGRAAKVGVQFAKPDTLPGRQATAKLARIASTLQRAELRRTRHRLLGAA